jgi:transposase
VLSLPPTVRVFVAVEPFDMRGSFDAIAGAVRRIGLDPVDGHLYLFLNKRRRLAKALWFDGSGWCLLAKRLEAGSFQLPPFEGDRPQIAIDGRPSPRCWPVSTSPPRGAAGTGGLGSKRSKRRSTQIPNCDLCSSVDELEALRDENAQQRRQLTQLLAQNAFTAHEDLTVEQLRYRSSPTRSDPSGPRLAVTLLAAFLVARVALEVVALPSSSSMRAMLGRLASSSLGSESTSW